MNSVSFWPSTGKVDPVLVEDALRKGAPNSRALPFRFLSAVKHAPQYSEALSEAMCAAVEGNLFGETVVLVDVSGSMMSPLSSRSQLNCMEAASALAVLVREMASQCRIFTFSQKLVEVSNFRGLPLVANIYQSQPHGGTYLRGAIDALRPVVPKPHRVVLLTDEQAHDGLLPSWATKGYIINVAPYKPGLDTSGGWVRINGFSERILDWMHYEEEETWAI